MITYLILLDIRGVKNYVEKRRFLYELRLASKKLKNALEVTVKKITEKYSNISTIYVGGGNALLESKNKLDGILKDEIKQKFAEQLSIDINDTPYLLIEQESFNDKSFQEVKDLLLTKTGKSKRQFHSMLNLRSINLDPNSKKCASCHIRNVDASKTIKFGNEYLCNYCTSIRQEGKKEFDEILEKILSNYHIEASNVSFKEFYYDKQLEYIGGQDFNNTQNNEIDSKVKFAVLNMDGNLFGYNLSKIKEKKILKDISLEIRKTVESIYEECINQAEEINKHDAIRMELGKIFFGGDDIKVLLPSRLAIPVAYKMCNDFRNKMKLFIEENHLNIDLQLSAGIAFSKPKIKLQSVFEVTSYLLNSSKSYSVKKNVGSIKQNNSEKSQILTFSSFDFQILLNDTTSNSLKTSRQLKKNNMKIYSSGYSFESKFWEVLCSIIPKMVTFDDISDDREKIKSNYILPWKEIHNYYLNNYLKKSKNDVLMFNLYKSDKSNRLVYGENGNERFQNNKYVGYSSALKFLNDIDEFNHLERAIEAVQMRYEL